MSMTAEQRWDMAIEAARASRPTASISDAEQAFYDAADCADQAVVDGSIPNDTEAWYAFAVGVVANDPRSADLFA